MSINRFSKVFTPSEYIAPFDLNTYANIGAQKDAQFEHNLQLLQSGVDQIAQTDILRPQDRQAFSKKLASVVNTINSHGTQDLGDISVLGNMQNKQKSIYGDQQIISAIGETQKVRKMQAQMEDDRKKGKLATQNEDMANDSIAAYMDPSDKAVGKSFDGRYIPHYEYAKKVMDVLSKAKADGYITRQTPINGGLQTETIKTKGLTDRELTEMAYGIVAADPQAQQQMEIDAKYTSKRMSDEGVTSDFQQYAGDIASDYKNQIVLLETKKQEVGKAGDKEKEAYYTGKIKEANDELVKYEGWANKENTASTVQMISQNKDGYYKQVFSHNFYKNAASIFSYQDQTRTVTTNMEAVLLKKNELAMSLASLKSGLKGGTMGGLVYNGVANEENNALTEDQLKSQITDTQTQITASQGRLRQRLVDYDKKIYGVKYNDPKNGNANWEKDYKQYETDYLDGNTKDMPLPIKEHFEEIAELNNKKERSEDTLNTVYEGMKQDPGFIVNQGKLETSLKKLPDRLQFKADDGSTLLDMSKEETTDIIGKMQRGDYETKTIMVKNPKSNKFAGVPYAAEEMPVEYQLLKGDSPGIRAINARIEANVKAAIAGLEKMDLSGTMFLYGGIGAKNLSDYMQSMGVVQYKHLSLLGKKIAAYSVGGGPLGLIAANQTLAEEGIGTYIDHIFNNNQSRITGSLNHNTIDVQLTKTGHYDTVRDVGASLNKIKNDYFSKAGIATMNAIKPFSLKADVQDEIKPVVQGMLGNQGNPDVVKTVISVSRNSTTNKMYFTYTTDKDGKDQKTAPVEPRMEAELSKLFPSNPMKDWQDDLMRKSAFKESVRQGSGDVSTTDDPAKAYTVPGTHKKARFFYHPGSKFGYRLYNGNGIWLDEHPVNSLDEVIKIAQDAEKTEKEENERRGITTSPAK